MSDPTSQPDPSIWYWDDFREGEVREFGKTVVRREDIVRFASEFDPQRFMSTKRRRRRRCSAA
jgi:acyl dehydratase